MGDSARIGLAALACAALAVGVHANVRHNGFAADDIEVVQENPAIRSLADLPTLFQGSHWGTERTGAAWLYRPVTVATFALDAAIWGGRPFGYHLTNALLHAAVAALLALWLGRFLGAGAALAGGSLFAVHPAHVEAVANVVGRAEILAALAYVGALSLYAARTKPLQHHGPPASSLFPLGGLYALAVLSKETAITLPAALFLLDAARGDMRFGAVGEYFARRLPTYGALALGAVVAIGARFLALAGAPLTDPAAAFRADPSFLTRLFTMMAVWPQYARLLVAPLDLSPDYSPAVILPQGALSPAALYGLGLVAAIFALAALAWRRMPWATAGPVWAAITLLPVSNLLFSSGVVLAERTLYLPSVGVALVVAGLTERSARAVSPVRFLWGLALAGAVGFFALLTIRQIPVWRSTEAVVAEILRKHPESYRGHWLRGEALAREDRRADAIAEYEQAFALWPYDERTWVEYAGHNLAWQRWKVAESAARQAVSLAPHRAAPWRMLATVLEQTGRGEVARTQALHGLAEAGHEPGLYRIIAETYRREGRHAAAARAFRAGLEPFRWSDWVTLALMQAAAGDTASAFAALDTARIVAPTETAAHDSIASVRRSLFKRR